MIGDTFQRYEVRDLRSGGEVVGVAVQSREAQERRGVGADQPVDAEVGRALVRAGLLGGPDDPVAVVLQPLPVAVGQRIVEADEEPVQRHADVGGAGVGDLLLADEVQGLEEAELGVAAVDGPVVVAFGEGDVVPGEGGGHDRLLRSIVGGLARPQRRPQGAALLVSGGAFDGEGALDVLAQKAQTAGGETCVAQASRCSPATYRLVADAEVMGNLLDAHPFG